MDAVLFLLVYAINILGTGDCLRERTSAIFPFRWLILTYLLFFDENRNVKFEIGITHQTDTLAAAKVIFVQSEGKLL